MSFESIELTDSDDWNRFLESAPQGTPFHRYESLAVFADVSGTTLHPLLVRKGQEPVGLFPVFDRRVGPVPVAFSPPPNLKVEYLGPVLVERQQLKRRRRENRLAALVDGALDWVDRHISPRYFHARTGSRFEDPRPFRWRGWSVTPRHTYVVDCETDPDDLFMAFSADARSNVRNAREHGADVFEGGRSDIGPIIDIVSGRHAAQGIEYPLDAATVRALYDALPDGVVRPYVCELDGEFVGGQVDLELGDSHFVWAGTSQRDLDVDPNDLIEWHAIQDAMDRGVTRYDFLGANNEHISEYKSKFSPSLERYFRLERASAPAKAAASAYQRLR